MDNMKLSREERIELAKRTAPKSDVDQREGLALGNLVIVNADMLALLQEDNAPLLEKVEKLSAGLGDGKNG